jgi:molybdate transport system permease protein
MDYEALWLTLRLAFSTTVVLVLIALPLAWWIAAGRYHPFRYTSASSPRP